MKKSASGFTLVELLIVIVVIAILAAISIVAYNGMTSRAYTSQLATAISSYDKALKMFAAEHGAYTLDSTIASVGASTCLGKASDYPATDMFPAGVCVVNTSNSANNVSFHPTLVNEMQSYTSDMPNVPVGYEVRYGSTTRYYRGAVVWIDGVWFEIEIALPSNISCPPNMNEYDIDGIHWCELPGQALASASMFDEDAGTVVRIGSI